MANALVVLENNSLSAGAPNSNRGFTDLGEDRIAIGIVQHVLQAGVLRFHPIDAGLRLIAKRGFLRRAG